jgi:hypothetical protein
MSRTPLLATLALICALGAPVGAQVAPTLQPSDVAADPSTAVTIGSERRSVVLRASGPARDPSRSELYSVGTAVYIESDAAYPLRFHVHAQEAAALPVARRTAYFLAALWLLARQRVGPAWTAVGKKPVEVWLTRSRPGGGAAANGSIVVYEALAPRSDLEWARTLAHEYGHLILPGAGGYAEPEPWSNGIVGERLFLGWLRDDLVAGRLSPASMAFAGIADLEYYHERQVQPLLTVALEQWPDTDTLAGRSKAAMNAFTGLMLGIDQTLGAAALYGLLDHLVDGAKAEQDGPAFLSAFRLWLERQDAFDVRRLGQGTQAFWLPAGRYQVTGAATSLSVAPGQATLAKGEWTVTAPRSGACALRWSGAALLHWKRLR